MVDFHARSLSALIAATIAGCAATAPGPVASTPLPELTCEQIVAKKDKTSAALNALYPKLKKEGRSSQDYWLSIVFPAMQPGTSLPHRESYRLLMADYRHLRQSATAQGCSPPLPNLHMDLVTRAYSENRKLFSSGK